MAKNKLIALGILAVLVVTFFQWAFIDFTVESQFLQVISMVIVIIGAVVAVMLFNKGESSHYARILKHKKSRKDILFGFFYVLN